jgi:hypothetical protein
MNSIESLRALLGWCSVINMGLLMLSTILLILMRGPITKLHSRLFGLAETDLSRGYLQFLAQYKIAILILNLAPYIATVLMS